MRIKHYFVLLACCALAIGGCGGSSASTPSPPSTSRASNAGLRFPPLRRVEGPPPAVSAPPGRPPSKLVVKDLVHGAGRAAHAGDRLAVQFVAIYYTTGKLFESSWQRGRTFRFTLNAASTSPGWVHGLPGMRVGGRRELIIPPKETSRYGVPPGTGPERTLLYVIDLLEARPPGVTGPATTTERARPRLKAGTGPPPKKLVVREIEEGTGPTAKEGDKLTVHYFGVYYRTGKPFSPGSWGYGAPRSFILGAGKESPGWEQGLRGMRVGGRRRLIIPPHLISPYGIPPGSGPGLTLEYVIDLVGLSHPKE